MSNPMLLPAEQMATIRSRLGEIEARLEPYRNDAEGYLALTEDESESPAVVTSAYALTDLAVLGDLRWLCERLREVGQVVRRLDRRMVDLTGGNNEYRSLTSEEMGALARAQADDWRELVEMAGGE